MLGIRLRYYLRETKGLLSGHWKIVLLVAAVCSPELIPTGEQREWLAKPISLLADGSGCIESRMYCLLGLVVASLICTGAQRAAISGGEFAKYAQSLPAPQLRERIINTLIVAVSSTPLFLIYLAAVFVAPRRIGESAYLGNVAGWAGTMLAAQVAFIEESWPSLLGAACSVISLLISVEFFGEMNWCWVISLMLCGFSLFLAPRRSYQSWVSALRMGSQSPSFSARSKQLSLRTYTTLSLVILFAKDKTATLGRLVVTTVLVTCALALMFIWQFDGKTYGLLLVAYAAVALLMAGCFRGLSREHEKSKSYMDSLPFSSRTQVVGDIVAVSVATVPLLAVSLLVVLPHVDWRLEGARELGAMISIPFLLAVLRYPLVHYVHQRQVVGILISGAWIAIQCAI
ncbi:MULTISPECIES: hypothetical protein [unclassified Caballeronia]|uniref:hypothetical protein n=1 Tax=unclassified Caballeronia TaxID=2646786 RepID=UPI00285842C3|nr:MULTISPECIES: hypothetical protein [unclassified Caballeronia]MDR5777257.1 hypothetical protein [Caballeronia sp. LZ002]MDR5798893.1 hypothetical protein [Caballeronia sp. LZ001]MDR5852695.1 hypothetical protein [Caballeronia sp. LZ003]